MNWVTSARLSKCPRKKKGKKLRKYHEDESIQKLIQYGILGLNTQALSYMYTVGPSSYSKYNI